MSSGVRKALIYGGLLVGGVALYFALKLAIGDEPPIRVKGGSLDAIIEEGVPPRLAEWREQGPNKWVVDSSDVNLAEVYRLKLKRSGGNCDGPIPTEAKHVKVKHGQQEFSLMHVWFHTTLTAKPGAQANNDRLIKDAGSGFVDQVWIHNPGAGAPVTCTFARGEFEELCLCDDITECAGLCN